MFRSLLCGIIFAGGVCSCDFAPDGIGANGDPGTDASATADSTATDGALSDAAAPTLVTLRETATDAYAGGAAWCIESAGTVTNDEIYERVFRLSDFGIASRFQVTAISFLVASAHRADSIAVKIGTYSGGIASTLDTSMMQWIAAAPLADIGDVASPTMETVAIAATIPAPAASGGNASAIVVSVASPNYEGMGGKTFHLASTAAPEGTPSYWTSVGCGNPTPSSTDVRNGADVGTFVIDVVGYIN